MTAGRPRTTWSIPVWLLAALVLPLAAHGDAVPETRPAILFSSVPAGGVGWTARVFEPAVQQLRVALGRDVRFAGEPTYDAWVEAAREDRFDYVIPPPHLVEEFIRQRGYHAVAISERSLETSLIALDTLPGPDEDGFPRKIRLGLPPAAATASQWTGELLKASRIAASSEVVEVRMQSHHDVILAVSRGEVDAGVTVQFQMDLLAPALHERLRVLATHEGLPLATLLANPRIPIEEAEDTGTLFVELVNSPAVAGPMNPGMAAAMVPADTETVLARIDAAKRPALASKRLEALDPEAAHTAAPRP